MKIRSMRRLLVPSLLIALTAGGLIAYSAQTHIDESLYRMATVERGALVSTVTSSGTVKAVVTVEVGSQLSGQVAELFVDFNDEVRRDQPLARIDPRTFEARVREAAADLEMAQANVQIQEAAVEKATADVANALATGSVIEAEILGARANYDQAERTLKRKLPMLKKGIVPESEVDEVQARRDSTLALLRGAEAEQKVQGSAVMSAESARRMAKAELQNASAVVKQKQAILDQAEVELERTVIRAPIDGTVIARNIDRGQTVAASLEAPTLFTIAQNLRQMRVEASVDEADIGRVKMEQRATFTVDAYRGRTFDGEVTQIRKAPHVIQNVVTYTVIVSADNEDLALLPGMTATVQIVVAEKDDLLKVPNAALRFRPSSIAADGLPPPAAGVPLAGKPSMVWVLDEDGAPVSVTIGTGASDDGASEVVSGPLTEGQRIIIGVRPPQRKPRIPGLRWGF